MECKHIMQENAIMSQRLQFNFAKLLAVSWLYPQSTVFSHVTHIFPKKTGEQSTAELLTRDKVGSREIRRSFLVFPSNLLYHRTTG